MGTSVCSISQMNKWALQGEKQVAQDQGTARNEVSTSRQSRGILKPLLPNTPCPLESGGCCFLVAVAHSPGGGPVGAPFLKSLGPSDLRCLSGEVFCSQTRHLM